MTNRTNEWMTKKREKLPSWLTAGRIWWISTDNVCMCVRACERVPLTLSIGTALLTRSHKRHWKSQHHDFSYHGERDSHERHNGTACKV